MASQDERVRQLADAWNVINALVPLDDEWRLVAVDKPCDECKRRPQWAWHRDGVRKWIIGPFEQCPVCQGPGKPGHAQYNAARAFFGRQL